MPSTRPPFAPDFRREAVELVRSGVRLRRVAADSGVSEQTLRNRRRRGDVDAGRVAGLTSDEREELRESFERIAKRRGRERFRSRPRRRQRPSAQPSEAPNRPLTRARPSMDDTGATSVLELHSHRIAATAA
jgi:transposase